MNKEKLLTWLVVADFVLAIGVIALDVSLHWTLPAALREAAVRPMVEIAGARDVVVNVLWYVSVASFVVAWIGLVSFWRHSRALYIGAWGLSILVLAIGAPSVMTGPGAALDAIGTLVSGSIIGLIYFSDLSRRYEAPEGRPLAAAAG